MTSKNAEKLTSVDQKIDAVVAFLAEHVETFRRQGSVVETWRQHRGRRLGPFYCLRYREAGCQRSVYLGRDGALANAVRDHLRHVQAPLRQLRAAHERWATERVQLDEMKTQWDHELQRVGLRLKGYEVRGGRSRQ